MIGKVFLGKPWHWGILLVATGLLWLSGSQRHHVIEFNWFIIALLSGTAVSLLLIIRFHREGEQITRDALVAQAFDPDESTPLSRD